MKKGGFVYIMTNQDNRVFYVGQTATLRARVYDHKTKLYPNSFTARYNCFKIVWYESFNTIMETIEREKQLKGGSRKNKRLLIEKMNPTYIDLWDEIQDY